MRGQFHIPAALPPGKTTLYSYALYRWLGWHRSLSRRWGVQRNLLPGIKHRLIDQWAQISQFTPFASQELNMTRVLLKAAQLYYNRSWDCTRRRSFWYSLYAYSSGILKGCITAVNMLHSRAVFQQLVKLLHEPFCRGMSYISACLRQAEDGKTFVFSQQCELMWDTWLCSGDPVTLGSLQMQLQIHISGLVTYFPVLGKKIINALAILM
jgi:hypothetical protein